MRLDAITPVSGVTAAGRSYKALPLGFDSNKASVEIKTEDLGAGQSVVFKLQGSNDGTNWFDIDLVTEDTTSTPAAEFTITTSGGTNKIYFVDGLDLRFWHYVGLFIDTGDITNTRIYAHLRRLFS